MTLLKNTYTSCLQGKQQNIEVLWNSNYFELILAHLLKNHLFPMQGICYKLHRKAQRGILEKVLTI